MTDQTITLPQLLELRAELDATPGRSARELDDELENLTEGDGGTDTSASFRHELGLDAS